MAKNFAMAIAPQSHHRSYNQIHHRSYKHAQHRSYNQIHHRSYAIPDPNGSCTMIQERTGCSTDSRSVQTEAIRDG
ncbi:MAG: hypothetical protein ACI9H8_000924 [Lysobacterales bacterium]|jgi:hypothetical protein